MIIWTVVSYGNLAATPVAVSQTSTIVPAGVCAEAQKMSGSDVKLPRDTNGVVTITVKCIPVKQ